MNIVRLVLLVLAATEVQLSGVDNHFDMCESCHGQRQSPINLETRQMALDRSLTDFTFHEFHPARRPMIRLTNDGHTVKVVYENGNFILYSPGLSGGSVYRLANIHFHWGSTDDVGSEHTIDGRTFPMEMHVVSWKTAYQSFETAMAHPDGLAVLAFLFEIQARDNLALHPLIRQLSLIRYPDNFEDIRAFQLTSIIPHTSRYYRYEGGLTTPPCSEVVEWTVFNETIKISKNQMQEFRNLLSPERDSMGRHKPLVDNFRPVQPINNRKVRASFVLF
ncbi:hypothetical protein C0Q70_09244 [Pomacea canaliculata]|uniref:Carbonic anhydrase n=1 Tax=Pomacea canaliculata TaxID=400727 RepID=A0A2T7P988_POMCA|nr:hypothetical protein C0Q70_09244 [Pomacea canaliculata]